MATWPVGTTSPGGGQLWKQGAQAPSVVGGKVFTPAACYPSSSDPKKKYTVCEVNDGTVSCDCMGWTRRNPPGGRTCKHTEDYLQYLRPLWRSGGVVRPQDRVSEVKAAPVQEKARTQGGSLADLMAKFDKEGL